LYKGLYFLYLALSRAGVPNKAILCIYAILVVDIWLGRYFWN